MTIMTNQDLSRTNGGGPWIGRLFVAAIAAVAGAGHAAGEVAGEYAYNIGIRV